MANEIIVTSIEAQRGSSAEVVHLLYLYPISPVVAVNGTPVVHTPSLRINQEILALNLLSTAQLTALDEGTLAYEFRRLHRPKSMTNAQILAKAREEYAVLSVQFLTRLRRRYELAGSYDAE